LLERCRAAGLELLVEGSALHVEFERQPPVGLLEQIRRLKPEIIVALTAIQAEDGPAAAGATIDPADVWHARYCEAFDCCLASHPAKEAARLAWGSLRTLGT
jgi:hypothetical protein